MEINEKLKKQLKEKILNKEKLTEEEYLKVFDLFSEKELVDEFPEDCINKIIMDSASSVEISPESLCDEVSENLITLVSYSMKNLSNCRIEESNFKYVKLLTGLQIFANNFISSLDNLKEGIKEGIEFEMESQED